MPGDLVRYSAGTQTQPTRPSKVVGAVVGRAAQGPAAARERIGPHARQLSSSAFGAGSPLPRPPGQRLPILKRKYCRPDALLVTRPNLTGSRSSLNLAPPSRPEKIVFSLFKTRNSAMLYNEVWFP